MNPISLETFADLYNKYWMNKTYDSRDSKVLCLSYYQDYITNPQRYTNTMSIILPSFTGFIQDIQQQEKIQSLQEAIDL